MRAIAAVVAALCIAPMAWAQEHSIRVGGLQRTYAVHLPNGREPAGPSALVVVFHGGGGNAANAARMTGMDAKADREGFIVAYPNGTGPRADILLTWNAWRCCGPALDRNVDDIAFVRAMVQAISREHAIDPRRIYATGMSNGGMLAYRVGCEAADVFAAIAPVAGALDTEDCKPVERVSVIAFHGLADQHVPFEGGAPRTSFDRHARVDNSVQYAMDFWKRRNGCEAKPASSTKGHVRHDAYACAGGTAVELYAIEGQGHAWPGGQKGRRAGNVDEPTSEISATDAMWDFFARHPKPPR
jgi:polyhydroxybutyrate depolymerase